MKSRKGPREGSFRVEHVTQEGFVECWEESTSKDEKNANVAMNAVASVRMEGPTSKDRWALPSKADIEDAAARDLTGKTADSLSDKDVALRPKS